MRQFVAEDDASAGKGVPLTADVVEHLTWIGNTVGPVLDEVRKAIHLTTLRKVRPVNSFHRKATQGSLLRAFGEKNSGTVVVRACEGSF